MRDPSLRVPKVLFPPTLPAALHFAAKSFRDCDYIVTSDSRLSFQEAEVRSADLAKQLLHLGVGKGTRVGLFLPSGPDWVVAWAGAGRIGALVMPLSTIYRPAELRRVLQLGDIDTLVVTPKLFGQDTHGLLEAALPDLISASSWRLFLREAPYLRRILVLGPSDRPWTIEVEQGQPRRSPDSVPDGFLTSVEAEVVPADELNVIFTSGTTAQPKAVVHTHGAVLRKSANLSECGGYASKGKRLFVGMPFFWVGGLLAVAGSLGVGGTVICQDRFEASSALDLIERERATALTAWPTTIAALRTHPSIPSRTLVAPQLTSHDGVDPQLRHGQLGMTETLGVYSANARDDAPDEERAVPLPQRLRGSSGAPLPFHEVKVVDPLTGDHLGDGVEGEFCARGYALMSGLYKRERHEVFDNDGWYHTGDRGFLRDGYVFFTGRTSQMIKARGANVAPREVELALEALPEVKNAFVVGLPDAVDGERIAAAVVPMPDAIIEADKIKDRLRREISPYKVPRQVLPLGPESVPWLASGKPDLVRIRELLKEHEDRS